MNYFIARLTATVRRVWIVILGWARTSPPPTIASGPMVTDFSPVLGPPGTLLEIAGTGFSTIRGENGVAVAGASAVVFEASATRLRVVTGPRTATGPVTVRVGSITGTGPRDFVLRGHPDPGSSDEGPPIAFAGTGTPAPAGAPPSTGTLNVLVSLVAPSDQTPVPAAARDAVVAGWDDVSTYYDQASYSALDVDVDVTSNWAPISGATADYVDAAIDNIALDQLDRLMAEAAQAAVDDGKDLDDYQVMVAVIYLNGTFIRAWGNWTKQSFNYVSADGSTNINLTAASELWLVAAQESANWGRFAHELGHAIVSAPSFPGPSEETSSLGEDVYDSDLIDPTVADAGLFELMGEHDEHPLFSGYHLDNLGWYGATNVADLQWDRNPRSDEFDLVAHGSAENADAARFHLIRLRVTNGLSYYIQARQRPDGTAGAPQLFDESIPINGSTNNGGVIVTTVLTDLVNMNQQMRFITLLHGPVVLDTGGGAEDPARTIRISVVDNNVQARPLVARVRVEWAQVLNDDPAGTFDVRLDPWDSSWQTPDIWVDRNPYGSFEQPDDLQGRPQGNGDKPRPGEVNKFWTRIHNDGASEATDVKVTFYSVEPPGVGDNGNWAPLDTQTIPSIAASGFTDIAANWTPLVDRHTCLKVYAHQQPGEVTGGNNQAQENVFEFEAPASSVPDPVIMEAAVRNPLDADAFVLLSVTGVPRGYTVYLPYAWLRMTAHEERPVQLIVVPTSDYGELVDRKDRFADVRVSGYVPRQYTDRAPSSHMMPIGGVTARVVPKRRVELDLHEGDPRGRETHAFSGQLDPPLAAQSVRVELQDPAGVDTYYALATTDASGAFRAAFEAKQSDGLWRAVARTINATDAAAAESKPVFVPRLPGTRRG